MARAIRDNELNVSAAMPNAANTVSTNIVDLGATTPYPTTEAFQAQVYSSTATGANNKNITFVLQHSDDTNVSNFANIGGLSSVLVVTDDDGGGYPAGSAVVQLPPGVKRHIRAQATGEANGGNAANGAFGLRLLF